MKAEVWQLTVYDGVLGWSHGWGSKINEVFIPELEIIFNCYQGVVNCWKDDGKRYVPKDIPEDLKRDAKEDQPPVKLGDIEISEEMCQVIQRYIESKEKLKSFNGWFKEEIVDKFKVETPEPVWAMEFQNQEENNEES